MSAVLSLIGNGASLDLGQTIHYAAILGESPSKGAKSPVLWNKAFVTLGISAKMHPMDVSPDQLGAVIDALRNDPKYIGGAVAVPYKQTLVELLDRVEPEAQAIGAINCIYRDGNQLVGTNTDGAGALHSLHTVKSPEQLKDATVVVLGIGGAGRAVAAYAAGAIGSEGTLVLANRTPAHAEDLAQALKAHCQVELTSLPVPSETLAKADVIINCSSIGFENPKTDDQGAYLLRPYTPLAPVAASARVPADAPVHAAYMKAAHADITQNIDQSLNALGQVDGALIYDIVYQPQQTLLLTLAASYGLPTLNGVGMNLEQAVIAFEKATRSANLGTHSAEAIRDIMKTVW